MTPKLERFFQFSLLGLVASGYFALADTGYLDRPTLVLTFAGLLLRALAIAGWVRVPLTPRYASIAAISYLAFLPVDYYFISRDFLAATVHGVCFLAVAKILTGRTNRDYAFTGAISFVELIAAALLSADSSFFGWLILYTVFAIAAFSSGEIYRSLGGKAKVQEIRGGGRLPLRLAAIALGATVAILVMTVGLFFAVPRTARMTARLLPNSPRLTGFSNEVDLGGFGSIWKDDRTVMHIRSYSRALPPDVKWRGAALSDFDGRRWREIAPPMQRISAAPKIAVVADRLQLSRRDGSRLLYSVDLRNSGSGTLFLAGIPEFINIDRRVILGSSDGAFRDPAAARETLRYQVSAFYGPELTRPLGAAERARDLKFPALDMRIVRLAREWAGDGPALDKARRIQYHLQRDFRYELEGPAAPVADPLADFLFVRKAGYCEYFASAMAVMLRSVGIPSRVATGFAAGYFNPLTGMYVVRASDAHAWVEAFLPRGDSGEGTWTTFDPTPAASGALARAGAVSNFAMYMEAADNFWHEWVVSYDLGHQVAAASQFEGVLRRVSVTVSSGDGWRPAFAALRKMGVWTVTVICLIAVIVLFGPEMWKDWRRGARLRSISLAKSSPSDASFLYQQMLDRFARRGVHKPASATPAEFAAQLGDQTATEFTELYNRLRFGGDVTAAARMASLLKSLNVV